MTTKKKPADLAAAGLMVTKGAATPPRDVPQRSAEVPHETQPGNLVPLQFRVPAEFREEFERYAFESRPRRKMVDVLKDAFEALKKKESVI